MTWLSPGVTASTGRGTSVRLSKAFACRASVSTSSPFGMLKPKAGRPISEAKKVTSGARISRLVASTMRIARSGAAWRSSAGQTSSSDRTSIDPCSSAAVRPGGNVAGGAKRTVRNPAIAAVERGSEAGRAAARHGNVEGRMIGHGHRGQDAAERAGRQPARLPLPAARLCGRVPFRVLRLRAWVGMNGWTVVELGALARRADCATLRPSAAPGRAGWGWARMNRETWPLFAIHLLTASGAAFALLSMMAITDGNWTAAFIWLGIALLVDGIDGPIARRYRVRERLPKWDGAALDFVIDYTTYVFVPAVIVAQALALPQPLGGVHRHRGRRDGRALFRRHAHEAARTIPSAAFRRCGTWRSSCFTPSSRRRR